MLSATNACRHLPWAASPPSVAPVGASDPEDAQLPTSTPELRASSSYDLPPARPWSPSSLASIDSSVRRSRPRTATCDGGSNAGAMAQGTPLAMRHKQPRSRFPVPSLDGDPSVPWYPHSSQPEIALSAPRSVARSATPHAAPQPVVDAITPPGLTSEVARMAAAAARLRPVSAARRVFDPVIGCYPPLQPSGPSGGGRSFTSVDVLREAYYTAPRASHRAPRFGPPRGVGTMREANRPSSSAVQLRPWYPARTPCKAAAERCARLAQQVAGITAA